jgi:hypothetical protein
LQSTSAGGSSTNILIGNPDGSVDLYHAGVKTPETGIASINIYDSAVSESLSIEHDSNTALFTNNKVGGNGILFRIVNSVGITRNRLYIGETYSGFNKTNNSTLCSFSDNRINFYGSEFIWGNSNGYTQLKMIENGAKKIVFYDPGYSTFNIQARMADNSDHNMFYADPAGAAKLYFNGLEKVVTTTSGAEILGDLTINGSLTAQDDDTRISVTDDGTNAGYIELVVEGSIIGTFESSSVSINGTISANNPITDQDLTTKDYVDNRIGRIKKVYSDSTAVDGDIIIVDTTNNVTITLIESLNAKIIVKNMSTGTVTIQGSSGNIDNKLTKTLTQQYWSLIMVSDGIDWFII